MNKEAKKPCRDFVPDKELIDFAKYFSENYKSLESGQVVSENGNYIINYNSLETMFDERQDSAYGFIRLGLNTGIIDISTNNVNLNEVDSDIIFYLIIWYNCKYNNSSDTMSDILTLDCYLKEGKPKKKILLFIINTFKENTYYTNIIKRYEILKDFVANFKN